MKNLTTLFLSILFLLTTGLKAQNPLAEIEGTVKANELLLYDSNGDLRFRINADSGSFQMLANDTLWYTKEVRSPMSETRIINELGWTNKWVYETDIFGHTTELNIWYDENGNRRIAIDFSVIGLEITYYDSEGNEKGLLRETLSLDESNQLVPLLDLEGSTGKIQVAPTYVDIRNPDGSVASRYGNDSAELMDSNTGEEAEVKPGEIRLRDDNDDEFRISKKNSPPSRWGFGPDTGENWFDSVDGSAHFGEIEGNRLKIDTICADSLLKVGTMLATADPLTIFGNVQIIGTLSKIGGSFKIDHPQDPSNKYLYHSFIESPDMMNVYNGNITTNKNGKATIALPDYFESLNIDFRYQLTVIGTFAHAVISKEIKDNKFEIMTDKPKVKVSWQVTGIRNDTYARENRIQVEVDKEPGNVGTLLYDPDKIAQVDR